MVEDLDAVEQRVLQNLITWLIGNLNADWHATMFSPHVEQCIGGGVEYMTRPLESKVCFLFIHVYLSLNRGLVYIYVCVYTYLYIALYKVPWVRLGHMQNKAAQPSHQNGRHMDPHRRLRRMQD